MPKYTIAVKTIHTRILIPLDTDMTPNAISCVQEKSTVFVR